MVDLTDSSAPPGKSTPSPETANAPVAETSQPPVQSVEETSGENELPTETQQSPTVTEQPVTNQQPADGDNSMQETSESTPVTDAKPSGGASGATAESTLPAFDTSLPSVGSTAAEDLSLPATDTNLPSLDSSLPAIGTDIPTMDGFHHDGQASQHANPGHDQSGHSNGPGSYQQPSNGTYQYSQSPSTPQNGGQQASQQHQFQQQPYQQQSPEMYHNPGGFTPANASQGNTPSTMSPMASMGQYMAGYPSDADAQMRYQLPDDPSKMSSRHKKEVKRRTKTGCLTCRKRRIKCDEGHPVCRNCVKSKRECLGYDPVFRPQASTPSAIQPAAPNPPPSLVVNPQGPPSSSAPAYPSAPPGYVPATSQPYAPALQSLSPSTSADQYDPGTTIDPSLGANHPTNTADMQNSNNPRPQGMDPVYKSKNLLMTDLIALRGIAPPAPHPIGTLPPGRLEEIQAVFLATYAPAIDKFLEVKWYSEKALSTLMADQQLMADYSALIEAFNGWDLNEHESIARLESFEASVIWRSMILCRQIPDAVNGQFGTDWNLLVACARLNVIEALLTWNHLDPNPLSRDMFRDAARPPSPPDQFMHRQLDFWDEVGEFLTLHDNEASSAKEIDDTLSRCRALLDTYENRDIIYSIAIARHLGQRWADFPNTLPKVGSTTEKEAGTKLYVAQKFLEDEAEGKGTTQIYKRICCMAVRSWWCARE
ncbi:uncharacterized protein PFLUO_LOCUS8924 [Penicillium psychrofluorescens]|uniref:uncharacterized protein n=1 Tax=Penicillium psychrofluorescens TaxID=3158075 RepID=UPI003CCD0FAA